MLITVPQYIDVEDKIVGPMTAKQLIWMIAMGVILFILWNFVQGTGFFVIGIPIALFFIAFAFYKPYGQPLGSFAIYGIFYYFKPKVYTWRRTSQPIVIPQKASSGKQTAASVEKEQLTTERLQGIAQILDSGGSSHNSDIVEYLRQKEDLRKQMASKKK